MRAINPIPSGPDVQKYRDDNEPDSVPDLPESWTATMLLTPFGDANSPLSNYSQLVVGSMEYSWTPTEHWMRTRLYLTQDLTYFDFVFISQLDKAETCEWYWIDSTATEEVKYIYGPLPNKLRIPSPRFLSDMARADNADALRWGNRYPLMCTNTHPEGIDCDHWIGGGTWFAFRRGTDKLFRILTMDSSNPLALPIVGSYYLANIPTFRPGAVSDSSQDLIQRIREGAVLPGRDLQNDMLTQEDIQRAMADPLASASCTPEDIKKVLPGFVVPKPDGVPLPSWPDRLYIEGWTLGNDAVPYRTRVCYLWTGDTNSKQQTVLIGEPIDGNLDPARPSSYAYLSRIDACLSITGTGQAGYEWTRENWEWNLNGRGPGLGLPFPDWLARDNGVVMGQIAGNRDFGLASSEILNLFAVNAGPGDLFWVWFLGNGVGMLFSEATFNNSFGHLEVIDYGLFARDAPVEPKDFSGPFPAAEAAAKFLRKDSAHGHGMSSPHAPKTPRVTPYGPRHG